MTALAGANQIYGAGMVESGVTFDLGQLVVDDEIARLIRQVLEGIPVRPDTLLLGDIQDAGWSGEFMSRESTLRGMRAMSAPRLFDRGVYEAWDAAGRVDLARRARDKALELLAEDGGGDLSPDARREVDAIVAHADLAAGVQ
jgi:trimethylamine--corrinoid protein Co-methyltransferase